MIMNFKSGTTRMTIDPDKFFPLPMNKLKKFTAILSQADFPECVEYLDQVEQYLKDRTKALQVQRSFYLSHYDKITDPDTVDEFYMNLQADAVRKTIDHIIRLQEKLRKNLEYVENR